MTPNQISAPDKGNFDQAGAGVAAEEATGQIPGPENHRDVMRAAKERPGLEEPVHRRTLAQPFGISDRGRH